MGEIKRLFVQNGKVIQHAMTNIPGVTPFNSLTDESCAAQKKAMGDINDFAKKGGMKKKGEALKRGMVLVMSLWDDHYAHMLLFNPLQNRVSSVALVLPHLEIPKTLNLNKQMPMLSIIMSNMVRLDLLISSNMYHNIFSTLLQHFHSSTLYHLLV